MRWLSRTPRTQPRTMDEGASIWYPPPVETTWRHRIALRRLAEGCTNSEAAEAAGVSRMTFWRWIHACPEFASEVAKAREAGQDERTFRRWLSHPFRGCRPPTGKGHGGKPRFTYGKR